DLLLGEALRDLLDRVGAQHDRGRRQAAAIQGAAGNIRAPAPFVVLDHIQIASIEDDTVAAGRALIRGRAPGTVAARGQCEAEALESFACGLKTHSGKRHLVDPRNRELGRHATDPASCNRPTAVPYASSHREAPYSIPVKIPLGACSAPRGAGLKRY